MDSIEDGEGAHRRRAMESASIWPKARFRVRSEGRDIPVIALHREGMSLADAAGAQLRGYVDLFDGARYLARCLVVAAERDAGVIHYEFKRPLTGIGPDALPADQLPGAARRPVAEG